MGKLVVHNKTGSKYVVVHDDIIECTKGFENSRKVLYYKEGDQSKLFVREITEFYSKFTPIE